MSVRLYPCAGQRTEHVHQNRVCPLDVALTSIQPNVNDISGWARGIGVGGNSHTRTQIALQSGWIGCRTRPVPTLQSTSPAASPGIINAHPARSNVVCSRQRFVLRSGQVRGVG